MRVISGFLRGKKLVSAPEDITRPTLDRAKESLFNILESLLRKEEQNWQNIFFTDAFAGSGAIGIEALSRGAEQVVFFEKNPIALRYLKQNLKDLKKDNTKLYHDALTPPPAPKQSDILFMDAPYHNGLIEKALPAFYQTGWIGATTLVIVETDKTEVIQFPPFLTILRTVHYGRNQFVFLKLTEEK